MQRMRKLTLEELFLATKHTLLQYGYEGFTFTIIANQLNVVRGTIYRYFENKEELITTYMVSEMEGFLSELMEIDSYSDFDSQFDYLLKIILKNNDIHQILGFSYQIPKSINDKVAENKNNLEQLHEKMYKSLQKFIELGKENNILSSKLSDELILGFMFQSVNIPNHHGVPRDEWIAQIKEIISHGIYK